MKDVVCASERNLGRIISHRPADQREVRNFWAVDSDFWNRNPKHNLDKCIGYRISFKIFYKIWRN
jgi:hypothetical protein